MRQRREASGTPDRIDGVGRAHTLARHIGRLAAAEEPLKGVLDAAGVTAGYEQPPDGRPPQRGFVVAAEFGRAGVQAEAKVAQPPERALESVATGVPLAGERLLEPFIVRSNSEAQDVELAFPKLRQPGGDAVDLDSCQQLQPRRQCDTRHEQVAVAGQRLLVGVADEKAPLVDDELQHAVRAKGVRMQVDRRWGGRVNRPLEGLVPGRQSR